MLREQIKAALKVAMFAKDQVTVRTLRLIMAAMKDRDIAVRPTGNCDGIDDDAILSMMQSMIKQRHDSIEMYEKGNRQDLADVEKEEIEIITQFLPQQFDDEQIADAVSSAIANAGASSIKDMGKVMGKLKGDFAGQMDFGKASKMLKETLAAL